MDHSQPSRRQIITAAAAATVTLPMLQAALGARSASAAAPASRPGPAVAEKAGWFATKLKPADVKEGEFTTVEGHSILLSRTGKDITALTSKCTHQGCDLAKMPKPGEKVVTCGCHGAQFNLDGTVAKAPARNPLSHFAIRTNADGLIEIDPGTTVTKDGKDFSTTAG